MVFSAAETVLLAAEETAVAAEGGGTSTGAEIRLRIRILRSISFTRYCVGSFFCIARISHSRGLGISSERRSPFDSCRPYADVASPVPDQHVSGGRDSNVLIGIDSIRLVFVYICVYIVDIATFIVYKKNHILSIMIPNYVFCDLIRSFSIDVGWFSLLDHLFGVGVVLIASPQFYLI